MSWGLDGTEGWPTIKSYIKIHWISIVIFHLNVTRNKTRKYLHRSTGTRQLLDTNSDFLTRVWEGKWSTIWVVDQTYRSSQGVMHLLAWQGWIIHPSILNRITCNPRPWYTQILFLKKTVNRTPLEVQRYQDLQKLPVSTLKCSYLFPWNNCRFLFLNN